MTPEQAYMRGVRADDCLIHADSKKYGGVWVIYNKEIDHKNVVTQYGQPYSATHFVAKLRRIEAEYAQQAAELQGKVLEKRNI